MVSRGAWVDTPLAKRIQRPALGLAGMTLGAGIRRANLHGNIGSRDPHAVIPPRVDTHIHLFWHVTINARRSSRVDRVSVMGFCVKDRRFMALGADVVTLGDQLITVRVVAVATDNPRLIHLALYK